MDLVPGRRVYIPSKKTFGNVMKTGGILGIKSSFAVVDDTGNKLVYTMKVPEFIYVDTSEDVSGEKHDIPVDIVPIFREKLPLDKAINMTDKFYRMSNGDREKTCTDWMDCGNSHPGIVEEKRPVSRKRTTRKRASTKYSS